MRTLALAVSLGLLILSGAVRAEPQTEPDADAVTAKNLLEREELWPYHVSSTQPVGPLEKGANGVLIRVEPSGRARIDFGRHGVHELPIEATNLIERANGVRLGTVFKSSPNFVSAIGPRLVDTRSDPPRPVPLEVVKRYRTFLAVFADPSAKGFAELGASLAPLFERRDLLVILFPQGRHEDPKLWEDLRAKKWKGPFVPMYLVESYTHSLVGEPGEKPTLQLQTPEGRVLFQAGWSKESLPELTAAVDRALGGEVQAATGGPS